MIRVGDEIVGVRHRRSDGGLRAFDGGCCCGCRATAGLRGTVIEMCESVDVVVAEFVVPCPAGDRPKRRLTAYSLREAQLGVEGAFA